MEVEYETVRYRGDVEKETARIADYLYNTLLYKDRYNSISKEKVHLEEQPKVVCEALGRLVSVLLDKNILNLDDLKYIADVSWGREGDSLKLKPEEKEE